MDATDSGRNPVEELAEEFIERRSPGYLGPAHLPFTVLQDPYTSEFQHDRLKNATDSFELANDITLNRIHDRRALLTELDRLSWQLDSNEVQEGLDPFTRQALELITSAKARRAFDLKEESAATRERYGSHRWGQMALLARRLVESGVTFVTLNTAPDCLRWDWHVSIVKEMREESGPAGPIVGMEPNSPPLDQALAALITDLSEREACRNVLLIVWGEFGRSPHWWPRPLAALGKCAPFGR
jgi:hypothetical protein